MSQRNTPQKNTNTVRKIHDKNEINIQNSIERPLEIPTGWVLRENHHRFDWNNSFCVWMRRDACYSHQLQTIAHTYLPYNQHIIGMRHHTESYTRRVIYMRVRYPSHWSGRTDTRDFQTIAISNRVERVRRSTRTTATQGSCHPARPTNTHNTEMKRIFDFCYWQSHRGHR